jgi:hypothetical protein
MRCGRIFVDWKPRTEFAVRWETGSPPTMRLPRGTQFAKRESISRPPARPRDDCVLKFRESRKRFLSRGASLKTDPHRPGQVGRWKSEQKIHDCVGLLLRIAIDQRSALTLDEPLTQSHSKVRARGSRHGRDQLHRTPRIAHRGSNFKFAQRSVVVAPLERPETSDHIFKPAPSSKARARLYRRTPSGPRSPNLLGKFIAKACLWFHPGQSRPRRGSNHANASSMSPTYGLAS